MAKLWAHALNGGAIIAPVPQLDDPLLTALGDAPCDGCAARISCALRLEACRAFELFVADAAESRWRAAARTPSRAIFEAVLGPVVAEASADAGGQCSSFC